eukprot:TRINITY_DN5361_c0_g2_i1.p3 TRINITY_DN5361_c0_g2~~TRINITY_DN5361_c0_g2_i1.p3  ORF type:complete len:105 (+),score=1.07 TRINITY_DN5361_c0_g2_i1:111-425(+)
MPCLLHTMTTSMPLNNNSVTEKHSTRRAEGNSIEGSRRTGNKARRIIERISIRSGTSTLKQLGEERGTTSVRGSKGTSATKLILAKRRTSTATPNDYRPPVAHL